MKSEITWWVSARMTVSKDDSVGMVSSSQEVQLHTSPHAQPPGRRQDLCWCQGSGRVAALWPHSPLEKCPSPLPQKPKCLASRAEQSYGGVWGRFLLKQKRWGSKRIWRRHKKVMIRKERRFEQLISEWAPPEKRREMKSGCLLYGNSIPETGIKIQECEETRDLAWKIQCRRE